MLSEKDEKILEQKGITCEQLNEQLKFFKTGFPFLHIVSPAEINRGIIRLTQEDITYYNNVWEEYIKQIDADILKFVPASGAASRMFKELFEFLESKEESLSSNYVRKFFDEIQEFAFYEKLNEICIDKENLSISELIEKHQYKTIANYLIGSHGLNYGFLPKGLLLFHSYKDENRTPVQEHFVESALYAKGKTNQCNIHFTVSNEHRELFNQHVIGFLKEYENKYNVIFSVSFSEQKPSTDTISVDKNNEPFRDENGQLVFRPGGHGALIENLNDMDADVIFIKNIDNVVPDSMKGSTVKYKKLIAGLLVDLQQKTFYYLKELENQQLSKGKLTEIAEFCESKLNNICSLTSEMSDTQLREYLFNKLNRPIRVCGMVKNTGEPGGGPFLVENKDGSVSTQILESSQIDCDNPEEKERMMRSTHFNPVDLVCGVKNYRGEKFNLLQYVDKNTGFISIKSKNGKELKALELPGLWNGAMSDWNTVFVEVPIETFNPVKTVNDLLRPEHQ